MATIKAYTRKVFLVPDSLLSMAAIHCKIKPNGEVQVRISDCNNTVKLWNNINNPSEVKEMIDKIDSLQRELSLFKHELQETTGKILYDKIDAVQN